MLGVPLLGWTLVGLSLGSVLGLGAALGSVVAGLYFLRVRRRRTLVPFVEMWTALGASSRKTAFLSQLTRLFSLLLQLVLLGLLLLGLGDPRTTVEPGTGRSLVLLVDVSASMATADEPGAAGTRLARAQVRARELIGGLGPRDQMLLVEMGVRSRPLSGWSRKRSALEGDLDALAVLDTSADLRGALELAHDALGGQPGGEIVVISDGALDVASAEAVALDDLRVSFESVASGAPQVAKGLNNLALTSFSARRYPRGAGGFEVLLAVQNASEIPLDAEVTIASARADGRAAGVLEVVRLQVPAGRTVQHSSADLSGAEGRLVAELRRLDGQRDAMTRDDVAYALLPTERQARVLVVGPPDTFVDAALLVDAGLVVQHVAASNYPPPEGFDVTIFDGVFPERVARTGAALYLGAPASGDATAEARFPIDCGEQLASFGFDHWEKSDPIFRFLDPYDIQVLQGRALVARQGDRVLARSDHGALLVSGERSVGRFLALGFSPRDSDFVLRVAFPLFLLNAIDALVPDRVEARLAAFSTGELGRFAVPGLARGRAVVRGPGGGQPLSLSVPVEAGQASFFAERAGFYEVSGGDRPIALAASLLSPEESALVPRTRLQLGKKSLQRVEGLDPRASREPWVVVSFVVLVLSALEWLTFHRRWTV